MLKKLRHFAEYAMARWMISSLDRLSVESATALVADFADAWYYLNVRRRRIAIRNVIQSGVCTTTRAASEIARRSYRHFGLVLMESIKSASVLNGPDWQSHVKMFIPSGIQALLSNPEQGIILATGHFGSWEIAAQALSHIKPVAGVTRSMNNPYVDSLIQRRKPRNRFHLVPKHDPNDVNRFVRILHEGEVLALMIDQHASGRGMQVDFFGKPASTHTAVALLHLVTHAPLCFGYCRRTGPSMFEFRAIGPYKFEPTGNRQDDVKLILDALNRDLENTIRMSPEQYLWGHRRWK